MREDGGVNHTSSVRPRLIATDLDGTLLRSDGTVSERTREALTLAEAAGLCIVFVTGRPPRWMDTVRTITGDHGIAICSNGAAVYDVRQRELVSSAALRPEDALAVVKALRAELPEVAFAFEYPSGFAVEQDYTSPMWGDQTAQRVGTAEEILGSPEGDGVFKMLARLPGLDPDEFLHRARAVAGQYAEITRSSPMLEISALGVSKATTLARWCAAWTGSDPADRLTAGRSRTPPSPGPPGPARSRRRRPARPPARPGCAVRCGGPQGGSPPRRRRR